MVADQAKGLIHSPDSRKLVAPLALTVFVWIFLMNFMDLIPVDFLPSFFRLFGVGHMKVVPTTDINVAVDLCLRQPDADEVVPAK